MDVESPESGRRKDNGYVVHQRTEKMGETFLTRAASASRDPGVVGPIVWTLKRQGLSTEGMMHLFQKLPNSFFHLSMN